MNCTLFQSSVSDLARGGVPDDDLRTAALDHAKACSLCAARLNHEKALSAGLRALATASRGRAAPSQVEERLLEAFRSHGSRRQARFQARLAWVGRVIATAGAAAAIGLLAFSGSEGPRPGERKAAPPTDLVSRVAGEVTKAGHDASVRTTSSNEAPRNKRRKGVRHGVQRRPETGVSVNPAPQREVVTEFIPVMYGQGLPPNEGGRLIRVQLPRSALWSFGLPMNVDRAGSRITADVLVGNDGMARAVRFVQ